VDFIMENGEFPRGYCSFVWEKQSADYGCDMQ